MDRESHARTNDRIDRCTSGSNEPPHRSVVCAGVNQPADLVTNHKMFRPPFSRCGERAPARYYAGMRGGALQALQRASSFSLTQNKTHVCHVVDFQVFVPQSDTSGLGRDPRFVSGPLSSTHKGNAISHDTKIYSLPTHRLQIYAAYWPGHHSISHFPDDQE